MGLFRAKVDSLFCIVSCIRTERERHVNPNFNMETDYGCTD